VTPGSGPGVCGCGVGALCRKITETGVTGVFVGVGVVAQNHAGNHPPGSYPGAGKPVLSPLRMQLPPKMSPNRTA